MSQGANKGPSQAAGNSQFVKFSRASAQRIAKAVRQVEAGDRGEPPVKFEHHIFGAGKTIRFCTFTGQWQTAATHVVQYYGITSTPNTLVAHNYHLPVDVSATSTECTIAKGGTAWHLVSVNLTRLVGYSGSQIQMLGHNASGYAQWYSVATCATA